MKLFGRKKPAREEKPAEQGGKQEVPAELREELMKTMREDPRLVLNIEGAEEAERPAAQEAPLTIPDDALTAKPESEPLRSEADALFIRQLNDLLGGEAVREEAESTADFAAAPEREAPAEPSTAETEEEIPILDLPFGDDEPETEKNSPAAEDPAPDEPAPEQKEEQAEPEDRVPDLPAEPAGEQPEALPEDPAEALPTSIPDAAAETPVEPLSEPEPEAAFEEPTEASVEPLPEPEPESIPEAPTEAPVEPLPEPEPEPTFEAPTETPVEPLPEPEPEPTFEAPTEAPDEPIPDPEPEDSADKIDVKSPAEAAPEASDPAIVTYASVANAVAKAAAAETDRESSPTRAPIDDDTLLAELYALIGDSDRADGSSPSKNEGPESEETKPAEEETVRIEPRTEDAEEAASEELTRGPSGPSREDAQEEEENETDLYEEPEQVEELHGAPGWLKGMFLLILSVLLSGMTFYAVASDLLGKLF